MLLDSIVYALDGPVCAMHYILDRHATVEAQLVPYFCHLDVQGTELFHNTRSCCHARTGRFPGPVYKHSVQTVVTIVLALLPRPALLTELVPHVLQDGPHRRKNERHNKRIDPRDRGQIDMHCKTPRKPEKRVILFSEYHPLLPSNYSPV